jgi:hypothetical protein
MNSADVGEYQVQLIAKLDAYPSVFLSLPFKITITAQLQSNTITSALPPYFDPELQTEFEIFVNDP